LAVWFTMWFRYDRDKLTSLHTISPGHNWTTLYLREVFWLSLLAHASNKETH
jgi:hypothetical protein